VPRNRRSAVVVLSGNDRDWSFRAAPARTGRCRTSSRAARRRTRPASLRRTGCE